MPVDNIRYEGKLWGKLIGKKKASGKGERKGEEYNTYESQDIWEGGEDGNEITPSGPPQRQNLATGEVKQKARVLVKIGGAGQGRGKRFERGGKAKGDFGWGRGVKKKCRNGWKV